MPLSQEISLSLGKPLGPAMGPRQYAYRLGRDLRGVCSRTGRLQWGFREISLSPIGGSMCEAIYKSFHPGSSSSLAMLCPSFASSSRAS